MRQVLPALATGTIFGAGLTVADMVNPARVLAFLDVFGAWDPALAFVMAGAMVPSGLAYLLARRMRRPLFHGQFHIPENRVVDRQLVAGGLLFGAGWGLAGYCPGPAIAGLVFGQWQTWAFVAAMLAGMVLHRVWSDLPARRARPPAGS